jgi:hypothetical protein
VTSDESVFEIPKHHLTMHRADLVSTLGFRVRSGLATAALVTGPSEALRVCRLAQVELCDPGFPETRQPYHAAFGTLESDSQKIQSRIGRVRAAADKSLAQFLAACRAEQAPSFAALVVGSLLDPTSIANPHIRAHALEGQLFRSILESLLRQQGVSTSVFLERSIYREASALLNITEAKLKQQITRLPHPQGPWRAHEKLAALAAWLVRVKVSA